MAHRQSPASRHETNERVQLAPHRGQVENEASVLPNYNEQQQQPFHAEFQGHQKTVSSTKKVQCGHDEMVTGIVDKNSSRRQHDSGGQTRFKQLVALT